MSELQSRLSHLVNYSSQLIFVSGDSKADQQKTLNDFLASQQDNTEVSFFTASSDKQASDYRGAICRQLGGHKVGSFVRPLQQLLSESAGGLTGVGPHLVCITQAEYLEPDFLQELWDWVMHAQQSNQDLHLNIILFGESAWAKSSQEWLPIQNSHKPVLLSSESVNPVGFDVNALEALMADKSSWFSTSNKPLVANKWFISSVLSIFLVVFVGLMAWQYPDHLASIFTDDNRLENNNANTADVDSALYIQSSEEGRQAIVDADTENMLDRQNIDATKPEAQSQLEILKPPRSNDLFAENISIANSEQPLSITKTLLVSNWSESVYSSNNTIDGTDEIITINTQAPEVNYFASVIPNIVKAEQAKTAQQKLSSLIDQEGDFQVPDIISVEQLDAQLSNNLPVDIAIEIKPEERQNNGQKDKQETSADDTALNYQFDEPTLLSLPSNAIVLQLLGIQNLVILNSYLSDNNMKATTWVYETQRYGGPWYVVLYRQSFDSVEAALSQLSNLPEEIKEAQPFAKNINQIRSEINKT